MTFTDFYPWLFQLFSQCGLLPNCILGRLPWLWHLTIYHASIKKKRRIEDSIFTIMSPTIKNLCQKTNPGMVKSTPFLKTMKVQCFQRHSSEGLSMWWDWEPSLQKNLPAILHFKKLIYVDILRDNLNKSSFSLGFKWY